MPLTFEQAANELLISPSEAEAFNRAHTTALVLGPHVTARHAELQLASIPDNSFVGAEITRYNPARLNSMPAGGPTERHPLAPIISYRQESAEENIYENLPYNSPYFSQLLASDPKRYEEYRDRVKNAGILGLDMCTFYKTTLFFGLLEKGCLFVPADATNAQLTAERYTEVSLGTVFEDRLFSNDVPSKFLYDSLGKAAEEYHDMARFRDFALVKNFVTLDKTPYREVLGYSPDQPLPTYIVRGSAHRNSIANILTQAGIDHEIAAYYPVDGLQIGSSFAPNAESNHGRIIRCAAALKGMLEKVRIADVDVAELQAVSDQLETILVKAAAHPDSFATARELLIRANRQAESKGKRLGSLANKRAIRKLLDQLTDIEIE